MFSYLKFSDESFKIVYPRPVAHVATLLMVSGDEGFGKQSSEVLHSEDCYESVSDNGDH